ncbi:esterase family protein [Catenisphaera adipataccumulans]|jgi:esterase/lipase superfamily enzyme|nr:alpha/beta hydrolase-fold protein [Catenisphaera adipataccumulans]
MQIRYFREYSENLNRYMEFKMYGHAGKICMVVPTQNNRFYEWEDHGMFDPVRDVIEDGEIQFIACDSIDPETWSNQYEPTKDWIRKHENWINYIIYELVPSVLEKAGKPKEEKLMVTGASMGATHAANLMLRYPDTFDTLLALSGIYEMEPYYRGYHDDYTYFNNPMAYLSNMPAEHPYIEKYNQSRLIFCVGQGQWEEQTQEELRHLADILYKKGIHAWTDFWGPDVYHDWPWWQVQLPYFIDVILHR